MPSATLSDVEIAIHNNNRKEAVDMLAEILRDKPSAEAWFLAAKLTNDAQSKVKYLRTALLIDPEHRKSKNLLRDLGEKKAGVHGIFVSELMQFIEQQGQKSPILRHLPAKLQLAAFVGVIIFFITMLGILFTNLFGSSEAVLSTERPQPVNMQYFTTDDVLKHFNASDIQITYVTEQEGKMKQSIRFELRDNGGKVRAIDVIVYDSIHALISDRPTLSIYEQYSKLVAFSNMVLIYPPEVPESFANHLIDVFETVIPSS